MGDLTAWLVGTGILSAVMALALFFGASLIRRTGREPVRSVEEPLFFVRCEPPTETTQDGSDLKNPQCQHVTNESGRVGRNREKSAPDTQDSAGVRKKA